MSMGRAEVLGKRSGVLRSLTAVAVSLLVLPLAACTDEPPRPAEPDVAVHVQEQIEQTLTQRGKALAARDERRFRRSLLSGRPDFVAEQETYFANLAQLPISEIDFRMDATTLVRKGEHYWGEVEVALQLSGYDARPVVTRDRFRFTRSRNGERYLLSSTTDPAWEQGRDVRQHPWDLGPIRVQVDSGVLGIFDDETIEAAENVLDAASLGRFDVAREVPDAGLVDVVVYATSDLTFLDGLASLPVSDADELDAVTIPVLADPARPEGAVASYRVMVHPRVLTEDLPLLDRLMRHELTHVALGRRADGVPLWLSEGIAEWVSVQPISSGEASLPSEALELAGSGLDQLPGAEEFSGADARAWYGVAWWICEYVVTTYDRAYLWRLLEEFGDGGAAESVIPDVLGLTPEELVREAMDLMRGRYA